MSTFTKTSRRREFCHCITWRWRAKDAPVAVEKVQSKFERDSRGRPRVTWHVVAILDGGEFSRSKHRTRRAAFNAAGKKL